jgi:hypothetical protein
MFAIEVIAEELREVVAGLEPDTFAGRDAARLAEVCARVERPRCRGEGALRPASGRDERMARRLAGRVE